MKRYLRAFTIVECVIVVAIIAILAAILIPIFTRLVAKANESVEQQNIRNLSQQLLIESGQINDADDMLDFLDRNGGEALLPPDSTLGWSEKSGDLFLFNPNFQLIYGEEGFDQRSVWLYISKWSVAVSALNKGYEFQYYHIGESSDEIAELSFSYNAQLRARTEAVFGGLTVLYRSNESVPVRVDVNFATSGNVLSVNLPNADICLGGRVSAPDANVEVCARKFLLTGTVCGTLALDRTAAELAESASCGTVTGDVGSSVHNGGQIYKCLKSLSHEGNAPTVLFDSSEWLATVSDSATLQNVFVDIEKEDSAVALSLNIRADVSLSETSLPLVFERKMEIYLNGFTLASCVPMEFKKDITLRGEGGIFFFSASGEEYAESDALLCGGHLDVAKTEIKTDGIGGAVLTGGGICEEVSFVAMDAACALTVRDLTVTMKNCSVNARSGSALSIENAFFIAEKSIQISGDNGDGIILSGGAFMATDACSISGSENGISVIGKNDVLIRVETKAADESAIVGQKNGISFTGFTGSLSIRTKKILIKGAKQYGIDGYQADSISLSVDDDNNVNGKLAAYSWT